MAKDLQSRSNERHIGDLVQKYYSSDVYPWVEFNKDYVAVGANESSTQGFGEEAIKRWNILGQIVGIHYGRSILSITKSEFVELMKRVRIEPLVETKDSGLSSLSTESISKMLEASVNEKPNVTPAERQAHEIESVLTALTLEIREKTLNGNLPVLPREQLALFYKRLRALAVHQLKVGTIK